MLNDCCDAGNPPGATGTSTGALVTSITAVIQHADLQPWWAAATATTTE
jgi:hypothetical protein